MINCLNVARERERESTDARLFSYENILSCYYECRKRKRNTINALKFEKNFEEEILKLRKELLSRTYKPGKSICFVVTKPKLREIFAADFRDRIVHHVLVSYLEPIWERKFIDQSYACRKGKGAHKAIGDLRRYMAKASHGFCQNVYYLQIDIQSFFVSLDKEILFSMIRRHTRDPVVLWLARLIIFHEPQKNYQAKGQLSLFDLIPAHKTLFRAPPKKGLPIGNLTSQFFANVYLNELDQFIKHKLKAKYYLRYVDDLVLLSEDKKKLSEWRRRIDRFLESELKLRLHPKKTRLQEIGKGIDFLGYVVKPRYALVRRRTVRSCKHKIKIANNSLLKLKGREQIAGHVNAFLPVVNSYFGHFRLADSYGLRRHLWQNEFKEMMKFYRSADKNINYLKIR